MVEARSAVIQFLSGLNQDNHCKQGYPDYVWKTPLVLKIIQGLPNWGNHRKHKVFDFNS